MIDTIIITLNKDQFEILDPDRFTPSARLMGMPLSRLGRTGCVRCHLNPSKQALARGKYRPRFTLTKRLTTGGYLQTLRAEFSAPKLLFGNNFEEISPENMTDLKSIFVSRALETGTRIFGGSLDYSEVSAVHFSKNFIFTDYTTSSMILRELAKLNLNSRLDLNKTDYRNDGHAVRFHANSYEVVFYDKMKDLQQAAISERRAIESGNAIQIGFLKDQNLPKQLEVLRMEVRLNTRKKIKSLCQKLGLTPPLTFREIFNQELAKTILQYFWDQVRTDAKWLDYGQMRPEDHLQKIVQFNPGIRPSKALQMLGLLSVMGSIGVRGTKSILGKSASTALTRLMNEVPHNNLMNPTTRIFQRITESLDEFKQTRLANITATGASE